MKKIFFFTQIFVLLFMGSAIAGTFNSGSTGADGAFNPTADTELQLPANGIFNYTTVNIPTGVTVTFRKNAANTPVYILATGDVIIAGMVKVDGGSSIGSEPGKGGPGGYDGGWGGVVGLSNGDSGKGLGLGGGGGGCSSAGHGGGGSFGTAGVTVGSCGTAGSTYGNERLIPLIGGSGGGGGAGVSGANGIGGGGGGGAILIASSGTITISGSITAKGGNNYISSSGIWSGGGSGGAIRLIANTLNGSGNSSAIPGTYSAGNGGNGRIRLEAYTNNFGSATSPAYSYGLPGPVFVSNQPGLSITSIAGVNVPASPTASYSSPDIALPGTTTNPVTVGLSVSNIPVGTTVTVSVIPNYGSATNVTATLSGTDTSSTASASVNLSTTYASVIMAQATFTLQTAMFWDGERIEKVRVAATMGKGTEVIYITETGKEIKVSEVMARSWN